MGRKKSPGLLKRGNYWHIDKCVYGQRLRESTGVEFLEEAGKISRKTDRTNKASNCLRCSSKADIPGSCYEFLMENQHKASIASDAGRLKVLIKYIGDLSLDSIHMGSLQSFIDGRRKEGRKTRTINHGLQVVRHILNLAAGEWIDEYGLTWLLTAPKIRLLPEVDLRPAYPFSNEEQERLFQELPSHLRDMALFAVNTGCRDQEICQLKWSWETKVGNTSVFIIPASMVKNRENRLVVLNDIAKSVVESVRWQHPEFVFTYFGASMGRMLNSAWVRARNQTDLPHVRVHDLKHTFGRRLRSAGVSFEDRQDLLGHKSCRITTHYSSAELENLIGSSNKVCNRENCGVLLRFVQGNGQRSRKSHAKVIFGRRENRRKCLILLVARGGIEPRHKDFQSFALPTELSGHL